MTTPFDDASPEYADLVQDSISFAGQEHGYFVKRKVEALTDVTRRNLGDLAQLRALDIGCGVGTAEAYMRGLFGHLLACDPSVQSAGRAGGQDPGSGFFAADGTQLPLDDAVVDLAFTINVLHHVDPSERDEFVAEMVRVVRPGGLAVVFEHNPLNPLTRLSVARCEFDEGVELLTPRELQARLEQAGTRLIEKRYVLFTPFDVAWQHRIENRLGRLPLGAQHYAAARKPA